MKNRFLIRADVAIAILTVLSLWVAGAVWTYVILRTETVFNFKSVGAFDYYGKPRIAFVPGEIVVIRREVCTNRTLGINFNPALKSSTGVVFPLPGLMSKVEAGCGTFRYGFVMPQLPPGEYSYVNAVMFQTSLVGRDEQAVFPSLQLRVISP